LLWEKRYSRAWLTFYILLFSFSFILLNFIIFFFSGIASIDVSRTSIPFSVFCLDVSVSASGAAQLEVPQVVIAGILNFFLKKR
jgi:hypothetical protein